jgi:hypothetical protein
VNTAPLAGALINTEALLTYPLGQGVADHGQVAWTCDQVRPAA